MPSLAAIVARNIRAARKAAGLSQEDLGRAVNVAQNTVSAWEQQARPITITDLEALATALHLAPAWFLAETHTAQPDDADSLVTLLSRIIDTYRTDRKP